MTYPCCSSPAEPFPMHILHVPLFFILIRVIIPITPNTNMCFVTFHKHSASEREALFKAEVRPVVCVYLSIGMSSTDISAVNRC